MDLNSTPHGQFHGKEEKTPTTELNIFLSKNISRRKMINYDKFSMNVDP